MPFLHVPGGSSYIQLGAKITGWRIATSMRTDHRDNF